MQSIAYVSSATSRLTRSELVDLLQLVRSKNPELGISGMLLYCGDGLMQVIEGPDEAVRSLYATIQADPRHQDVITLFEETIAEPRFKHSAMGMRQMSPRELEQVSGWTDLRQAAARDDRSNRDAVFHLLATFHETMS